MKGQKENQAAMIQSYKRRVMKAEAPQPRMGFVNKGDPSHGVESGPDRKEFMPVKKVDACGYGYKGYASEAWEY